MVEQSLIVFVSYVLYFLPLALLVPLLLFSVCFPCIWFCLCFPCVFFCLLLLLLAGAVAASQV